MIHSIGGRKITRKWKDYLKNDDHFNYGRRLVFSIFSMTPCFEKEKKLNVFLLNQNYMHLEKEDMVINCAEDKSNFDMPRRKNYGAK